MDSHYLRTSVELQAVLWGRHFNVSTGTETSKTLAGSALSHKDDVTFKHMSPWLSPDFSIFY